MLTAISFSRLLEVHSEVKRRVIQLDALVPSVSMQISQGLRTWGQQEAIWQQGRTTHGAPCVHDGVSRPPGTCAQHPLGLTVTNAKAGYSAHNFGYAVDVVPEDIIPGQPDWNISHPAWKKILAAAPGCGLAEGAAWRTFPDNPHLYLQECPADPTDAMRALFTSGGMAKVWASFAIAPPAGSSA